MRTFLKDHPCITPYYLSGPHSAACVKKLWKNSGYTDKTPYGETPAVLGSKIRMAYKKVGEIMDNTNTKTRDNVYNTAVQYSDICFGNHDNVDPCDPKFSRTRSSSSCLFKRKYFRRRWRYNGNWI